MSQESKDVSELLRVGIESEDFGLRLSDSNNLVRDDVGRMACDMDAFKKSIGPMDGFSGVARDDSIFVVVAISCVLVPINVRLYRMDLIFILRPSSLEWKEDAVPRVISRLAKKWKMMKPNWKMVAKDTATAEPMKSFWRLSVARRPSSFVVHSRR